MSVTARTALVFGALALAACGRSSPLVDFCHAREGLSCATLATERAAEEAEYSLAVTGNDPVLTEARGSCVQAFVAEQLEDGCIADEPNALCAELCTLHPCGVRAADGTPDSAASCPARCVEVQANHGLPNATLQTTLQSAAHTPGLCTCAVCDLGSAALCDELWVC